jgi:hypothetical protein
MDEGALFLGVDGRVQEEGWGCLLVLSIVDGVSSSRQDGMFRVFRRIAGLGKSSHRPIFGR